MRKRHTSQVLGVTLTLRQRKRTPSGSWISWVGWTRDLDPEGPTNLRADRNPSTAGCRPASQSPRNPSPTTSPGMTSARCRDLFRTGLWTFLTNIHLFSCTTFISKVLVLHLNSLLIFPYLPIISLPSHSMCSQSPSLESLDQRHRLWGQLM